MKSHEHSHRFLFQDDFLADFEERTKNGRREIHFHFLIRRYNQLITSGALGKRDTVKKNFRPHSPDWVQFDVLSDYLGFSKIGLFTLLLVLDIAGWSELLAEKFYNRGVPPTISEFS
ncbi:MAG: DUF1564 domain-containing protein [Leptospira sp.]|nr:DUF1564 domain-containing protein [Leptospira sp.]